MQGLVVTLVFKCVRWTHLLQALLQRLGPLQLARPPSTLIPGTPAIPHVTLELARGMLLDICRMVRCCGATQMQSQGVAALTI